MLLIFILTIVALFLLLCSFASAAFTMAALTEEFGLALGGALLTLVLFGSSIGVAYVVRSL